MSELFNITSLDSDEKNIKEGSKTQICGICKKQVSKYTCPRCDIKYCSLNCYKNEIHSHCTESFYKDNVIEEIKSQRVDDEQKQKMLNMLNKFEKENDEMAREEIESNDKDDEVDNDISFRFRNIDLASADFDTVWNKLTLEEKEEFEQKYINGKSDLSELSDELLLWKPWWEITTEYNNRKKEVLTSKIVELNEDESGFDYDSDDSGGDLANRPPIISDIKNLEDLIKTTPNPAISLNLLNILYAYAYTCRTFNGDVFENPAESCKVLWDLSPILATNGNLVYESISQAIAASSSLTFQNPIYSQPQEFSYLILDDIVNLLSSTNNVLAALSDLYRLFQQVGSDMITKKFSRKGKMEQKLFSTEKKVYFYVVYVNYLSQQLGSSFLEALREASADFDTVWNKLTLEEKEEFEQKYINGKSDLSELSDELLLWKPWWEITTEYNNRKKEVLTSKIVELNEDESGFDYDSDDSGGDLANRPPIISDIKNLEDLIKTTPNPAISLNLLNILYAYAYTCRTFNGDVFENPAESCKVLWDLSPILATNGNLVYESISQAIAASSSLTFQNPIYSQPQEFSYLILDDIVNLLSSTNNVLAALSDLYRLFQQVGSDMITKKFSRKGKMEQKLFSTEKKVYFYVVYVNYLSQQLGSSFLEALREGIELERQEQLKEVNDYMKDQKNIEIFMNERDNNEQEINLIQEI
ncbi:hypothetical protein RclHR1_06790006 [Rhizophagus clarus]|uniref:HIT-type domain-containing protein n=1 Tax=Rhizophagus clarus TaxID=94130 RepID=A0A2Z6SB18_9GLOM|nr:hypothetical protein RclHR1_06790006 [Rhizophagus clarus]